MWKRANNLSGGSVVASGTFQGSTSVTTKITLGFKPKFLYIGPEDPNETYKYQIMYDDNFSITQYLFSGGTTTAVETLGNTTNNRLSTIDNDGFTFNKCGSGVANNTWRYTAIE